MPWKPTPPEILLLLESALSPLPCEKKQMFGCPVYFADGSLFAGVHDGQIFLRLSPLHRDAFFREYPDALPFEPMAGRRMREYIIVPAVAQEENTLRRWIFCAHGYAASLPPSTRRTTRGRR